MSVNTAFCPRYGATMTATTVTAGTAVSVNLPAEKNNQLALINPTTGVVFVRVRLLNDAANASALDYPLMPGTQVITIDKAAVSVSVNALAAAGVGAIYLVPGEGI